MTKVHTRVPYYVLVHVLILSLFPASAPSNPAAPEPLQDTPSAEDIALLDDLAGWIETRSERPGEPLAQTIRQSAGFNLFRSYHATEVRHERLRELPYGDAIRAAADRHGVDGLLIASVVEAESGFDPLAVSRRGAIGLMQVMPATAALGETGTELLAEPELNLEAGTRYLRYLLERFGGDLELALAAYNAGPGSVRRYGGLPPFRETRRYVEKVLQIYVNHHRSVWQESETGEFLISGLG